MLALVYFWEKGQLDVGLEVGRHKEPGTKIRLHRVGLTAT